MDYCLFKCSIAKKVGINEAIILENIRYWLERNKANEQNFYEGKFWTYNSTKTYSSLFGFLTEKQVRKALENLESSGYIESNNFNQNCYDRTKWYTLTENGWKLWEIAFALQGKSIRPTGQMESPPGANGFAPQGGPIPNIYQDNTNNINTNINNTPLPPTGGKKFSPKSAIESFTANQEVRDAFMDYMEVRKKKKVPNTERAITLLINKLKDKPANVQVAMLNHAIMGGWQSLYDLRPEELKELRGENGGESRRDDGIPSHDEQIAEYVRRCEAEDISQWRTNRNDS